MTDKNKNLREYEKKKKGKREKKKRKEKEKKGKRKERKRKTKEQRGNTRKKQHKNNKEPKIIIRKKENITRCNNKDPRKEEKKKEPNDKQRGKKIKARAVHEIPFRKKSAQLSSSNTFYAGLQHVERLAKILGGNIAMFLVISA